MEEQTKISDVYEIITLQIIKRLEEGVVPWKQPWTNAGLPCNLITLRPYSGINAMLLASFNFTRNYFLTFHQVNELGGSVIKGSKSIPVVFWKPVEKENDETSEIETIYILQYYNVFNIEQCEGLPEKSIPVNASVEINPVEACTELFKGMPNLPVIQHHGSEAYYHNVKDIINMPFKKLFTSATSYYSTLFHEIIHSTGHKDRLARKEIMESTKFASEPYSQEELVAEIGACFLKSHTGIPGEFDNNVAYIQHWLEKLKNDKRLIVFASAKAQKAVDYILNKAMKEAEIEDWPLLKTPVM